MTLPVHSASKSFALNRLNDLLEKTFSVVVPLIGVQMLGNALSQSHLLNPWSFWPGAIGMTIAMVGLVVGVWVTQNAAIWLRLLVAVTTLVLVTWRMNVVAGQDLPANFQPWIWWAVGLTAIASIGAFAIFPSALIVIFLPVMWFFVRQSEAGGNQGIWLALQEAATSFMFSATFVALVIGLRYEASKVDAANQKAAEAAVELARVDAIERERGRVDALVHDSVLTTLLVAANAQNPEQRQAATELATAAIAKLNEAKNLQQAVPETISVSSLFSALEQAASRAASDLVVYIEGATDAEVPSEVAAAVSEATIQSVTNSVQHAGTVSKRELFLRGSARGFKVVIKDNGRGFRPSRIPKNRLGVRLSVIGRVESVGGRVFFDTKPGEGTSVILEWNRS
jgi:signal transduction histidine kinase